MFEASTTFSPFPPRLRDLAGTRPNADRVRQLMEENPGLGELQAYRMEQQRMAIVSSMRTTEGRRYLASQEARRHEGS